MNEIDNISSSCFLFVTDFFYILFNFFGSNMLLFCHKPGNEINGCSGNWGVRIIYMHSEGAAPLLHAHTLRTHRLHCLTGEIKTVNV